MTQPKIKKYIIIETIAVLALVSNFLLPGIAFSQEYLYIGAEISCGPSGITLFADTFEIEENWDRSDRVAVYAFGSAIGYTPSLVSPYMENADTIMPEEAMIKITDERGEGPGCAQTPAVIAAMGGGSETDGFIVTAYAPNWSDGLGHSIPSGSGWSHLSIGTTTDFDDSSISATHDLGGGTALYYPIGYPSEDRDIGVYYVENENKQTMQCNSLNDIGSITYPREFIHNYDWEADNYREGTFYTALLFCQRLVYFQVTASTAPYTTTVTFTFTPGA
jgi:hypothetical protein